MSARLRTKWLWVRISLFKSRIQLLSYCFEEKIRFGVKASFVNRPVSCLIWWYNKPGDITKEFWEKAIQFLKTFHGFSNWVSILDKVKIRITWNSFRSRKYFKQSKRYSKRKYSSWSYLNVIFDISLESLGGNPYLKKKSIVELI